MSVDIQFIGTGDAFGSGGRRNSAILVRHGGRTLLLDCGPTTLGGLKQLGIDPREIDVIAISHFHGDHIGGVPFMLLDYEFERERTAPLELLGPPSIAHRIRQLSEAYAFSAGRPPIHPLRTLEYEMGQPIELEGFRIVPMPAHHPVHTRPHMLRVEVGGQAIVFSGDTGWHEPLPRRVGPADLFICECVFVDEAYEYHLSSRRLEAERHRFDCERMILTHLGSEVLDNVDQVPFDLADDGLRLQV